MPGVRTALSRLVDELVLLGVRTGRTLWRLAAPVGGLMLLGWSADQLSILVASEISSTRPWLVVVVLAVGVVLQLAAILAVLRLVAVHLGIPGMLARAALAPTEPDQRDTSPMHLLTTTLVPFLAMYAAFGFVADDAGRMVTLATYREGYGDLLGALNPLRGGRVLAWTVAILVVGFLVRKTLEPWRERSRFPLAVGALQILLEAVLLLFGLLVGFRVVEEIGLWFGGRAYQGWLDAALNWAAGILGVDLPAVLAAALALLTQTIWPLVVDGLTRPLLWLAMAGLVFGTKVLALADLWRVGAPATQVRTRRERLLARLRADTEVATGVRLVVLRGQAFLLGGLDGTVLPAWQSLRLVLRAGWPFLGAFVIAFTVLDLARDGLRALVVQLVGGHDVAFWLRLLPLVDLAPAVLGGGAVWVLLGVAYTRALSIFAAEGDVEPVLVPGSPTVRDAFGANAVEALTAVALAVAVVAAAGSARPWPDHETNTVDVGRTGALQGASVTAGEPRLARAIEVDGVLVPTDLVFVVVPVVIGGPGPDGGHASATLRAGERSYRAWSGFGPPIAPPGFTAGAELLFEVEPADLGPHTAVQVAPVEVVSAYQEWVEIPLGLPDDAAATAEDLTTVRTAPVLAAA